jgi:Na+-driven multidrug efflux pump
MMKNLCEGTAMVWIIWKIRKEEKYGKYLIPLSMEGFKGWKDYLKITLPIASVVYLNSSYQEILTIFIGMASNDIELAAHASFNGINLLFILVPIGISWT